MCIVSMVHTEMGKQIPVIEPDHWFVPIGPSTGDKTVFPMQTQPAFDFSELKKLIEEFRDYVRMAKLLDEKLNQPNCLDPEKAKLEDRLKELEALILAPPEFVIVSGGPLEPGRYRVIEGKLYKAVE